MGTAQVVVSSWLVVTLMGARPGLEDEEFAVDNQLEGTGWMSH